MLPDDFINRIGSQPYLDSGSLIKSLDEPPPVSIRINNDKWRGVPVDGEKVMWCDSGWYLRERPSYTLDPLFHAGCYYPQEASGMFLGYVYRNVIGTNNKIKVLDLCGAPGGKSTHLSSLIAENGLLVANEVIRSRASVLAENLTKWGLSNSIVTNSDPAAFSSLGEFFDLVVADLPCSGEGMFRDEVARKEWSVANTVHCSERQRRIVMDVWPSLKKDGFMIYSTCTFNPAENEENIKWLSEQTGVTSLKVDITHFPGIMEIEYKGLTGYSFQPGRIRGEGLFVAVLRKETGGRELSLKHSPPSTNTVKGDWLRIAASLTDSEQERYTLNKDIISLLPASPSLIFNLKKNLRVVKGATDIARITGNGYIPHHDLAMSVKYRKGAMSMYSLTRDESIAYLRRDNIPAGKMDKGWVIVTCEGVRLGFVKNIGSRLNNYYPVDWRIRMLPDNPARINEIVWQG